MSNNLMRGSVFSRRTGGNMDKRAQNPLGVLPIPKLLMTMSAPIMLSMLVQAMYNVVDSIFVLRLSEQALTAVSLAFPAQNLMIAVSVGTAVGANALISRRLGEKNYEDANLAANNAMFLALVSALAFMLFGIFGSEAFYRAFTQDEALISKGVSYLRIVCGFPFGIFFAVMGERFVQMTGRSIYSMYGQMSGAIVNIILDPILIFGLLGMPRLGTAGAALATVIGQVCSMITVFWLNHKVNHELTLRFSLWKPVGRIVRDIYSVGLPSILMQAIGSVMTFGMNKILIAFGETAVNVFGIYFKLQSFVFMPLFGLNNGMVPIIGYNFGARKKERIFETVRLALYIGLGVNLVGTLIFQLLPRFILTVIFKSPPDLLEMGVPALRIISTCFMFAAVSVVLSGTFQALGKGTYSMIMSFCRQLLVLLPSAWLLGKFFGVHAVWWSFLIAEIVAMAFAVYFYVKMYNRTLKDL